MTHPEPVVLALDVGTTSTKAGAYTTSGGLVAAASSGYALRTPHAGHAVQDAGEILAAVFDAARWPSTVYRGVLSVIFTFVIPLALMTSYPAGALLGRLPWSTVIGAWVGGLCFALAARGVWLLSIRRYTSASS